MIFKNPLDEFVIFFDLKYFPKSFSQECRVSRYFTEANSREESKQVKNIKKWLSLRLVVAMTTVCNAFLRMKTKLQVCCQYSLKMSGA